MLLAAAHSAILHGTRGWKPSRLATDLQPHSKLSSVCKQLTSYIHHMILPLQHFETSNVQAILNCRLLVSPVIHTKATTSLHHPATRHCIHPGDEILNDIDIYSQAWIAWRTGPQWRDDSCSLPVWVQLEASVKSLALLCQPWHLSLGVISEPVSNSPVNESTNNSFHQVMFQQALTAVAQELANMHLFCPLLYYKSILANSSCKKQGLATDSSVEALSRTILR